MWIKRGCCGLIDLRTQTMMIAGFYTVSNFTGQRQIFETFNNFIMFFAANSNSGVEPKINRFSVSFVFFQDFGKKKTSYCRPKNVF